MRQKLKLKVSLSENDINEFLTLGFLSTKTTCHPGLLSLSKGKIYKYDNYDDYKNTQTFYNKKKIHHVWADEENLIKICNFIKKNVCRPHAHLI